MIPSQQTRIITVKGQPPFMNLPKARTENIVVQNLQAETLIYDLATDQAFCLNDTSAKVFEACDGRTTFEDLKSKHKFTDEIIYLALDGLRKENLLDESAAYTSPFAGMNRREVIRKVGLASMIALPIISSMIAPHPAQAASGALLANGQACSDGAQCRGAICAGGQCCSSSYMSSSSCSSSRDCCFGGNGVFCGINAAGTRNVCCGTGACTVTRQCCNGLTCQNGQCR